jgi:hypothetical protein
MNARDVIVTTSVSFVLGLGAPAPAVAARCPPGVFLSIEADPPGPAGSSDKPTSGVVLSEAQIMAMPPTAITTSTEWTPTSRFEGPPLSAVLALAGVRGKSIRLFALDDYSITIPWTDMERYGIILAHSQNGERLSKRKFGPLFLIYPRDQFRSALDTPTGLEKFIWQICRIDVE